MHTRVCIRARSQIPFELRRAWGRVGNQLIIQLLDLQYTLHAVEMTREIPSHVESGDFLALVDVAFRTALPFRFATFGRLPLCGASTGCGVRRLIRVEHAPGVCDHLAFRIHDLRIDQLGPGSASRPNSRLEMAWKWR